MYGGGGAGVGVRGIIETRASGAGDERDGRFDASASRTSCESSVTVRRGRHSSRPSRHTSESSVTEPCAAFFFSSARRIGPTGTPLIAVYHSSSSADSIFWVGGGSLFTDL